MGFFLPVIQAFLWGQLFNRLTLQMHFLLKVLFIIPAPNTIYVTP
jgi:hypothetical protein